VRDRSSEHFGTLLGVRPPLCAGDPQFEMAA